MNTNHVFVRRATRNSRSRASKRGVTKLELGNEISEDALLVRNSANGISLSVVPETVAGVR